MRVLYLNHNVIWRSTFYRCVAFGRELVRLGHQVTLLTIHPTSRWGFRRSSVDGVEVIETPDLTGGLARSGWDPWDTLARILWLRGRSFDLVHAFDGRPAVILPALAVRRRLGIPLVMDWADWWGRGGIISERRSIFLRRVFAPVETFFEEAFRAGADGNTVISRALGERALTLGANPDRLLLLPGGVDPEVWQPRDRGVARARLSLPPERPILLFSGFVHYDVELVFGLTAELRRTHPEVLLVLTGRPRGETAQLVRAHGLEDAVEDRGTVPAEDVPWYVAAADLCLVPYGDRLTNRARWPNKAGDYMAMGRPLVTNPVGELGRLVEESGAGVLAAPEAAAMAAAAARIIERPELARKLGAAGRRVAEERLAYRLLVRPLLALYEDLLAAGADDRT